MTKLEMLHLEESDLQQRLLTVHKEIRNLNTEEFLEKYNLGFGDIVEFTSGRERVKGQFFKIKYNSYEVWTIMVYLFNSDGKVGKRTQRVWMYNADLKVIEKAK